MYDVPCQCAYPFVKSYEFGTHKSYHGPTHSNYIKAPVQSSTVQFNCSNKPSINLARTNRAANTMQTHTISVAPQSSWTTPKL
jgi:hypothetical protein